MSILESLDRLGKAIDRLDKAAASLEARREKQKDRMTDLERELALLSQQRQKQNEKKTKAMLALDRAIEQFPVFVKEADPKEPDENPGEEWSEAAKIAEKKP